MVLTPADTSAAWMAVAAGTDAKKQLPAVAGKRKGQEQTHEAQPRTLVKVGRVAVHHHVKRNHANDDLMAGKRARNLLRISDAVLETHDRDRL